MGMRCQLYGASEAEVRQLRASPAGVETFLAGRSGRGLSLEKSWHGLHFVLAGDAWGGEDPWCALLGGEPVGEDLGYGPARVLSPDYVANFANALAALTPEEFDSRFDLDQLAAQEIYPGIWDEEREELLEEYRSYFDELKRFVAEAARRREAVVILLT